MCRNSDTLDRGPRLQLGRVLPLIPLAVLVACMPSPIRPTMSQLTDTSDGSLEVAPADTAGTSEGAAEESETHDVSPDTNGPELVPTSAGGTLEDAVEDTVADTLEDTIGGSPADAFADTLGDSLQATTSDPDTTSGASDTGPQDVLIGCASDTFDLDGDPSNGCECVRVSATDLPDDQAVDANCDGFDGDAAHAIFVAPLGIAAGRGDDPTSPVSLARAVALFVADPGRNQFLLASGAYVTNEPFELLGGMRLSGGYGADFGNHDGPNAVVISLASTALIAEDLASAAFVERIDWRASAATTGASIAVVIRNAEDMTLRRLQIVAGDGAPGPGGAPGALGVDGELRTGWSFSGQGGSAYDPLGDPGGCGHGGAVGSRGVSGCSPTDGGRGGIGCDGAEGPRGQDGSGTGGIVDGLWVSANGHAGAAGEVGGGGGAGGFGGSTDCSCGDPSGGIPGNGGHGGTGGSGGAGGTGGGASIGLFIFDSSISLQAVSLVTAQGGDGGPGGDGGEGGRGGDGGFGLRVDSTCLSDGGDGGDGGEGGQGGCGGGGGGGPSIGLVVAGDAALDEMTATTFVLGAGGTGGMSCDAMATTGTVTERWILDP